jgi:S1-C subfamily serine protease
MTSPISKQIDISSLPVATQWRLDSNRTLPNNALLSVALVFTSATGQKGTGWLISDKHVVTNEHVIRSGAGGQILVQFADGITVNGAAAIFNALTDIAVITLEHPVPYPILKIDAAPPSVGEKICAWGHPLGYNGPAPILSVGYVAGFNAHHPPGLSHPQRRLVLNAALNPGNSGGPIFVWGDDAVRGVAVTKHAPISSFLQSALSALQENKSGVTFSATDEFGRNHQFVESQIVAQLLHYFRDMTQVVIGEAISTKDVIDFLNANNIPWVPR